MSEEIKYIELVTWNRKMILLHGDKLTSTQKAIGLRSNGLHSEIRFSDRYGRISFSCTLADECGCCRFKMIDYSHPYRQSRVRIPVTAEQEARLFAKACDMADVVPDLEIVGLQVHLDWLRNCYSGPNAIKYDEWGARLSFISRRLNWWKMHPDKMICNEACATVLIEVWPDMLAIKKEDGCITFSVEIDSNGIARDGGRVYQKADPAQLTPDQLDYLVEYYFSNTVDLGRPNSAGHRQYNF